jgi:hypothetical protein
MYIYKVQRKKVPGTFLASLYRGGTPRDFAPQNRVRLVVSGNCEAIPVALL